MFCDNAKWHSSRHVLNVLHDKKLEIIFNVPYCPDLNPIEKYFSQLKALYRSQRLKTIEEEQKPTPEDILAEVIT